MSFIPIKIMQQFSLKHISYFILQFPTGLLLVFATDKPVIMDFAVEREEGVYPMVPAGADITEMLLV